ncbi:glycosyltransferase [Desulfuromonas sp. TF]|uniref:glycosyltransferase family 2 protein n=1 Tax=Desulfuromonas sp. TF TaxID=1232410 RepID=UPI0003FB2C48|nr:glycosyltransferase [Desulfuromonas sp. TF]
MTEQKSQAPVRVTVLMPVYQGAAHLDAALDSILDQTFANFELLVVDDGSTDDSTTRVTARRDERIRLLRQPYNLGLVAALNRGLDEARGEYVARMDADDISLPQRLEKQLAFMDANPDVGICGTWMEAFSQESKIQWQSPGTHDEILCRLLFESVLYHPTVMLRKALVDKYGLRYNKHYPYAEDYELWSRCARLFRTANMGEVLLRYRIHGESIGGRRRQEKLATASRVRKRSLEELGLTPSVDEMAIHDTLALWDTQTDRKFLERVHAWLLRLQAANQKQAIYTEPAFSAMLAQRWFYTCEQSITLGAVAYRAWHNSPFKQVYRAPWQQRLQFWRRCLLGAR